MTSRRCAPLRDEVRDLVDDGGRLPGARTREDDDVLFLRVGDFTLAGMSVTAVVVRH